MTDRFEATLPSNQPRRRLRASGVKLCISALCHRSVWLRPGFAMDSSRQTRKSPFPDLTHRENPTPQAEEGASHPRHSLPPSNREKTDFCRTGIPKREMRLSFRGLFQVPGCLALLLLKSATFPSYRHSGLLQSGNYEPIHQTSIHRANCRSDRGNRVRRELRRTKG